MWADKRIDASTWAPRLLLRPAQRRNLALQCSTCNLGGLCLYARARCGLSLGVSLAECAVQFCLDIYDSGFELRLFRFGGCRALTLDVDLGLQCQIRCLAVGGQLLKSILVVLEPGDRLLGLAHLGFEGGGVIFGVGANLVDL